MSHRASNDQFSRVYYGLQRVQVTCRNVCGGAGYTVGSLFQSVGVNASTEYEQIFELGRAGIYANIEGIPTAEITVERAMTAESFGSLWGVHTGSSTQSVSTVGNALFDIQMAIKPEGSCASTSESGFVAVYGAVMTNYSMNFSLDGPITESATYEATNIGWSSGDPSAMTTSYDHLNEAPSGIVLTRNHVIGDGPFSGKLQSASFSISIDREDVLSLGYRFPVMRPVSFPVEATAEFEYLVGSSGSTYGLAFNQDNHNSSNYSAQPSGGVRGDQVSGKVVALGVTPSLNGNPTWIALRHPYLTSSSYSGGDAGGGNATITHTFTGYDGIQFGSSYEVLNQNLTESLL